MKARAVWKNIWWYVRELSGETAYENYLAHRERQHPGEPVLSRREFEACVTQPQVRCC
jgi:uncharacterized short protein YbdD (DUF466 family)